MPQKTIHVPAGRPVELVIPIAGRPPPAASWFFAGSKLQSEVIECRSSIRKSMDPSTTLSTSDSQGAEYRFRILACNAGGPGEPGPGSGK